jgi:hypothetical protein
MGSSLESDRVSSEIESGPLIELFTEDKDYFLGYCYMGSSPPRSPDLELEPYCFKSFCPMWKENLRVFLNHHNE